MDLSYFASFTDADALAAIRLTFLAASLAVPLNLVFGVAAAWAIAKFEFVGKQILTTLIDIRWPCLPSSRLDLRAALRGAGLGGPRLAGSTISRSSLPAGHRALAITFVTVPFIARELIR
jgi:sulfate transport system permease protein